jgi:hypothetical protein
MTKLGAPVNTAGIDTSDNFELMPEGWYQAVITASDEDSNSKGNGRFIKLEFTIGSGQYSGKVISMWINYVHSTAKAQEIALKQLARLMEIVRVPSPLKDTAQFHGKSLEIQVGIDGTYNRVEGFRERNVGTNKTAGLKELHSDAKFDDLEEPEWAKGNG